MIFFKSYFNCSPIHPENFRPFGKGFCLPIMLDIVIASSVILLLLHRGPLAVAWFVVSVILFSLYGQIILVSVRHRPGVKVFKLMPRLTDINASASISRIAFVFRVFTSLKHFCPNSIDPFRGLHVCSSQAATRFYAPSTKMLGADNFFRTASATTKKIRAMHFMLYFGYYKQSFKLLSSQVDKSAHHVLPFFNNISTALRMSSATVTSTFFERAFSPAI